MGQESSGENEFKGKMGSSSTMVRILSWILSAASSIGHKLCTCWSVLCREVNGVNNANREAHVTDRHGTRLIEGGADRCPGKQY